MQSSRPNCGTAEYHRWYRLQKKLNDPEYCKRQAELQKLRTKKYYERIKDTITEKERQQKYYREVTKPKLLALKLEKQQIRT
jgi:CDP-diacylglycerol pyrophosphatase